MRNIINFENTFTKFCNEMNTVRKFDGSSNRGRVTGWHSSDTIISSILCFSLCNA